MLSEESYNSDKLGKRYQIYWRKKPEYTHETKAQKTILLIRERKQTFNKNLKSFIGGKLKW